MKTKSRNLLLILLLAFALFFGIVAVKPLTAFAIEPQNEEPQITEVASFEQLLSAVNSDKTYIKLTTHIVDYVPDDELPTKHRLVFDGSENYVLDLGGYVLGVRNDDNEFYTGKFSMIDVKSGSNLEIKDGVLNFDNVYSGSERKSKGVVSVEDTSSLVAKNVTMKNGYTGSVVSASDQASVTLDGGDYTVQNGFALYLTGQASLTLDGGVYIHTVMGDSTPTLFVDGYGALYSKSTGALTVNHATFKSGVQVTASQIGAFSIATHEVTLDGKVLEEDVFVGTNVEAKAQNKEYYWYEWDEFALEKTENVSFCVTAKVISYEKKYPIELVNATAMVNGTPVTEASYNQMVTIVANEPEAGKEFVWWGVDFALEDYYTATTSFKMPAKPVKVAAYYGNEAIATAAVEITAPKAGEIPSFEATSNQEHVQTSTVEWFIVGQGSVLDETDIFYPGITYGVRILIRPAGDYKFADSVSPTVNDGAANIKTGTSAYQVIEYHFATLPINPFMTYYKDNPQLGVGGAIELDIDAICNASDTFTEALGEGKVSYQWFRDGKPIEGANESVYAFVTDDIGCNIFARVTADTVLSYGETVVCTGDLFHVYFNMTEPKVGGRAPQITSATPGISIDAESFVICEMLGENSPGLALDIRKSVLIPSKTYRVVAYYQENDPEITVGVNASFYVNGEEAHKDGWRLMYEFTMPAKEFDVQLTSDDEIGVGAELKVTQVANASYQWYKNGEAIDKETSYKYIVGKNDSNSLIHCVVTKNDGSRAWTEQIEIGNRITVLRFEVSLPKNNTKYSSISKSVNVGSIVQTGWMLGTVDNLGDTMQGGDLFVEGNPYVMFMRVEAPEGLMFKNDSTQTKAYCNGTLVGTMAGCDVYCLTINFMFEFTAIHKHEYSDSVWAHDNDCHWQPCVVPGCQNPNEEWEMYTPHYGGGATCQQTGICSLCQAEYLGEHDIAVSNYVYFDELKCVDYCATDGCDYISSWNYHTGGVATCENKAICEICYHEYGEKLQHAGGTATCTQRAVCSACGEEYGETIAHDYNMNEWGYKGADGHAHACSANGCEAHDTLVPHTPDRQEATENDPVKCSVCGYIITPATGHITHTPKAEWKNNAEYHWHECTGCEGQELEKAAHADENNDGACDACGYAMSVISPSEPQNPNEPEEPKDGLSTGAIVAIAVSGAVVAGVGGFAVVWLVIKKKSLAELLAIFKKK